MQAPRPKSNEKPDRRSFDRAEKYPIALTTKRLQSAMHAKLEAQFLRQGVTLAQWDVLCSVREHPGASGAAIARDCLVTPQTVSLVLPKLEQMSLVERRRADRGKTIETHITDKGVKVVNKCNRHMADLERILTSALANHQAELLVAALKACVIAVAGKSDPKVSEA